VLEVPRRKQHESKPSRTPGLPRPHRHAVGTEERLKTGTVTKIVRSYGASWGRIAVTGGPLTYFNETSFADADDFDALTEGDAVVFELADDPVNGSRAVAIEVQPAAALEATGSEA
jgi:hypothetical protein